MSDDMENKKNIDTIKDDVYTLGVGAYITYVDNMVKFMSINDSVWTAQEERSDIYHKPRWSDDTMALFAERNSWYTAPTVVVDPETESARRDVNSKLLRLQRRDAVNYWLKLLSKTKAVVDAFQENNTTGLTRADEIVNNIYS